MVRCGVLLLAVICLVPSELRADLEWIKVSSDRKNFVLAESNRVFTPWGFNYDHDLNGTLIEDYWDDHWDVVEAAFQEMKKLKANVVRIHLQTGRFMKGPREANQHSLSQLKKLVSLAEEIGLYLDLTGLGCYHKQDVPAWYNELSEEDRWETQANLWEAIAQACAGSPAIFCYDLMNEPVVPGGDQKRSDWLGPAFAGKHFVQWISLDRAGRERPEIAKAWIHKLVTAIRKHDQRHLVTVGLVPWSLDRPGLTSGFVPELVTSELDFVAVHIYPEQGKLAESLDTLKDFAACGKPVVIEEIFPLKCSPAELGEFIDLSDSHSAGWIGFYWGKTVEQLRREEKTPAVELTIGWLELFQTKTGSVLNLKSAK